jgi:hypothetical protein
MKAVSIVDAHKKADGSIILYRKAKNIRCGCISVIEIDNPENVLGILAREFGYSLTKLPPDTRTPTEKLLDTICSI